MAGGLGGDILRWMYVVGTAGHVDHGKSALVRALSGIDPDRLREEKERGLTIDLGFAWVTLPSGREVSIVDVPGHERFIRNMLAGVGGIDMALLVVAADEGVMPQTREHLAIIDLLRIDRGLVVATKRDLVDEDWMELVASDIADALKGTTLQDARMISVSSVTGEGLPELLAALDETLDGVETRADNGHPRLPIDRAFTISGFGTVVTGTLVGGGLSVGDEVELAPGGQRGRVRGIQTHRQSVKTGAPGTRVAANLSGISHESISRGQILTDRGWLKESRALDVRLRVVRDSPVPVKHRASVSVHLGTSETLARVRLLDEEELVPGESGWAQLHLQYPIAAVKGDLFVIRSHQGTLGGGEVIETLARRHKRFSQPVVERLSVLAEGRPEEVLLKALESGEPMTWKRVVVESGVSEEDAGQALESLMEWGAVTVLGKGRVMDGTALYTGGGWTRLTGQCREALQTYHRQHPLRTGLPKEELRSRLGLGGQVFGRVVEKLVEDGAMVEEGSVVRLPEHSRALSVKQQSEVDRYLAALDAQPFSPPTDLGISGELVAGLVDEGRVVRVNQDVIFSAVAYEEMRDRIVEETKSAGKINVGKVRDMFDTSRKYALALMEYLDQKKITRRMGDDRVLR